MNAKLRNDGRRIETRVYTLVEILAVLAIVGILAYVALPAFQKLTRGNGVQLGATTLTSKLRAARAHACAEGKRIALLLPMLVDNPDDGPQMAVSGDQAPAKMLYRDYIVCEVDAGNEFVDWIEGESWQSLPAGVSFDFSDLAEAEIVDGVPLVMEDTDNYGNLGSEDMNNVAAIIFNGSGGLVNNDTVTFQVAEKLYGGDENDNYEAEDSEWRITAPDPDDPTKSKNLENITVNRFTGRVGME